MKNLSFLLGTFIFLFSFCQPPVPSRTKAPPSDTKATEIHAVKCQLQSSEVFGYLDFVKCNTEESVCAHFLIPDHHKQVRGLPLGHTIELSGNFSLEGAATGRKYYYLVDELMVR